MIPRARYLIPLLGFGLASTTTQAQGLDLVPEFKVRIGNSGKSSRKDDHLHAYTWGIGVGVTGAVGKGRLGVELGYFAKGGDPYLRKFDPNAVPAGKFPVDTTRSIDQRTNTSEGIALRLSYAQPMTETLAWNVGLMLGGSVAKINYEGDVLSAGGRVGTTDYPAWYALVRSTSFSYTRMVSDNPYYWRDTYAGSKAFWYKGISPYLGVKMDVTSKSYIELNVLVYNYKAVGLVHYDAMAGGVAMPPGERNPHYIALRDAGHTTNRWQGDTYIGQYSKSWVSIHNDFPLDHYVETKRWVPHLELNYGFRF